MSHMSRARYGYNTKAQHDAAAGETIADKINATLMAMWKVHLPSKTHTRITAFVETFNIRNSTEPQLQVDFPDKLIDSPILSNSIEEYFLAISIPWMTATTPYYIGMIYNIRFLLTAKNIPLKLAKRVLALAGNIMKRAQDSMIYFDTLYTITRYMGLFTDNYDMFYNQPGVNMMETGLSISDHHNMAIYADGMDFNNQLHHFCVNGDDNLVSFVYYYLSSWISSAAFDKQTAERLRFFTDNQSTTWLLPLIRHCNFLFNRYREYKASTIELQMIRSLFMIVYSVLSADIYRSLSQDSSSRQDFLTALLDLWEISVTSHYDLLIDNLMCNTLTPLTDTATIIPSGTSNKVVSLITDDLEQQQQQQQEKKQQQQHLKDLKDGRILQKGIYTRDILATLSTKQRELGCCLVTHFCKISTNLPHYFEPYTLHLPSGEANVTVSDVPKGALPSRLVQHLTPKWYHFVTELSFHIQFQSMDQSEEDGIEDVTRAFYNLCQLESQTYMTSILEDTAFVSHMLRAIGDYASRVTNCSLSAGVTDLFLKSYGVFFQMLQAMVSLPPFTNYVLLMDRYHLHYNLLYLLECRYVSVLCTGYILPIVYPPSILTPVTNLLTTVTDVKPKKLREVLTMAKSPTHQRQLSEADLSLVDAQYAIIQSFQLFHHVFSYLNLEIFHMALQYRYWQPGFDARMLPLFRDLTQIFLLFYKYHFKVTEIIPDNLAMINHSIPLHNSPRQAYTRDDLLADYAHKALLTLNLFTQHMVLSYKDSLHLGKTSSHPVYFICNKGTRGYHGDATHIPPNFHQDDYIDYKGDDNDFYWLDQPRNTDNHYQSSFYVHYQQHERRYPVKKEHYLPLLKSPLANFFYRYYSPTTANKPKKTTLAKVPRLISTPRFRPTDTIYLVSGTPQQKDIILSVSYDKSKYKEPKSYFADEDYGRDDDDDGFPNYNSDQKKNKAHLNKVIDRVAEERLLKQKFGTRALYAIPFYRQYGIILQGFLFDSVHTYLTCIQPIRDELKEGLNPTWRTTLQREVLHYMAKIVQINEDVINKYLSTYVESSPTTLPKAQLNESVNQRWMDPDRFAHYHPDLKSFMDQ